MLLVDDSSNRAPAKASKDPSDGNSKSAEDPSAGAPVVTPPPPPLTIKGLLGLLQQQPQKDAPDTTTTGDSSVDTSKAEANQQKAQPNLSALRPSVLLLTATVAPPAGTTKVSKTTDTKTPPKAPATNMPAAIAVPAEFAQAPSETDNAPNSGTVSAAAGAAAGAPNGAPAQETANTASANGAAALTPHAPLAFSMLVSPENGNATPTSPQATAGSPDAPALAADVPHFSSAITAAAAEAAPNIASEHPSEAQANTMAAPLAQAQTTAASDDRVAAAPSSSSSSGVQLDSASTDRNESVRNVRLQVEGENNQRVDVRLTDLGGELRVNVRSADATLTQAMQDHMPDLTNRLQQQHFRTEVWLPRSSQSSNSDASNTRGSNSQAGDTSGQQNSGRRQNGRQNNQPDWQNEETSSQTGTKETNQIWQA